jgi:membrane-bound metal-dependent hydrolase YbcI (DUF457 family)
MKNKLAVHSLLWALLMLVSAYLTESSSFAQTNLIIMIGGWFMIYSAHNNTSHCRVSWPFKKRKETSE